MKKTSGRNIDPSLEEVVIVDRNNRVIGSAPRWRMRRDRLIHRASYVIIFNSKDQILVQKRTETKDVYPGLLEIAAGGVVGAGESYEDSAERELQEETGICNTALSTLFDFYFEDSSNRIWGRVFTCTWDGRLTFQEEEVEWGKFFGLPELEKKMSKETFTPDSVHLYNLCRDKGIFLQS